MQVKRVSGACQPVEGVVVTIGSHRQLSFSINGLDKEKAPEDCSRGARWGAIDHLCIQTGSDLLRVMFCFSVPRL